MKDSDILKAARKLIASYDEDCVCYAIETVVRDRGYKEIDQANSLYAWICHMLSGAVFYDEWLRHRDHIYDHHSARQGRLAWLDWMIAYCKKQEQEQELP